MYSIRCLWATIPGSYMWVILCLHAARALLLFMRVSRTALCILNIMFNILTIYIHSLSLIPVHLQYYRFTLIYLWYIHTAYHQYSFTLSVILSETHMVFLYRTVVYIPSVYCLYYVYLSYVYI
jgi:hypothetical protein